MAGAHRNANGQGTADVAHLMNSVFHEVHKAWDGPAAPWQIHVFNDANHSFPPGTDAVLPHGDGAIWSSIVHLDAELGQESLLSYSYNTMSPTDPLNILVNGGVPGTTFASLGATTNVQGIHARSAGGVFVHVELEQSIRFNSENMDLAASAIADAMTIPEPPSGIYLFVGGCLLWRRRRVSFW
jgi:hypothetical protein